VSARQRLRNASASKAQATARAAAAARCRREQPKPTAAAKPPPREVIVAGLAADRRLQARGVAPAAPALMAEKQAQRPKRRGRK